MSMQKPDIAGIYPLSSMQQTLLLHSLHVNEDQGFLQVRCRLEGSITMPVFRKAVERVFQKHKALRASIHWEKISKPVQVVHKHVDLTWRELDWSDKDPDEQESHLHRLLENDRSEKLNLTKALIARFYFIQLGDDQFTLIWTCHHILVDAWSSSIALTEILQFYEALMEGNDSEVSEAPSFYDHLKWVADQDLTAAKAFWQRVFMGIDRSYNVMETSGKQSKVSEYGDKSIELDKDRSQLLRDFARHNAVSLNAVFQGLWSLLLGSFLGTDQVLYGITANGRSGTGIADPEHIIGMFMNVLPMRVKILSADTFSTLIGDIQQFQNESFQFDFLSLRHILELDDISLKHLPFDTLFIFQNVPEFGLQGGGVSITDYDSNVTSTYPLTFVVQPQDSIAISVKYDLDFDVSIAEAFINNLVKLIDLVTGDTQPPLSKLREVVGFNQDSGNKIEPIDHVEKLDFTRLGTGQTSAQADRVEKTIVVPRNDIEYTLYQLWEETLEYQPISIRDDFFEIGGTSLLAIILFDRIEKRFNREFSPTLLMVYPTIEQLGSAIEKNIFQEAGKSVTCLKEGDAEGALFCLHSIGGQVLFYHPFVQEYGGKFSLYGIQANKESIKYLENEGIERVAEYYLQEIRKVQPNGPYAIMSFCNTNSIAMEMAQQLMEAGEKVSPLMIIDAMPVGVPLENLNTWEKLLIYLKWLSLGDYKILIRGLTGKFEAVRRKNIKEHFDQKPEGYDLEKKVEAYEVLLHQSNTAYRVKPYGGDIYYIQSNEVPKLHILKSVHKTWRKIIGGKMTTYTFKGDHVNFFRKKNARKFADLIESILKDAS